MTAADVCNIDALAHQTNHLARIGEIEAATGTAVECISAVMRDRTNTDVHVAFLQRDEIGVDCDQHVLLELRAGHPSLSIPCGMVHEGFSNAVCRFSVIAALLMTYSVRRVRDGRAVIDLEDGSYSGDYDRLSFSCPLPKSKLIVDPYYLEKEGYKATREEIDAAWIPWEDRQATVFWRGSTTGLQSPVPPTDEWHWRWLPRLHLCDLARRSPFADRLDIGVVNTAQIGSEQAQQAILLSTLMRQVVPRLAFMHFRYLIDIDGNANAWDGLFGSLLMGSCVLKVTSPHGWKQWYYDRLVPGVHYIPIKADFSNFDSVVDWVLSNPEECAEISRRARQFAVSMVYEDEVELSGVKLAELLHTSQVATTT